VMAIELIVPHSIWDVTSSLFFVCETVRV
jgi:hypothetical protein